MNRRFDDQIILVTGGSSGIGQATAIAFAKEGAQVIIADIDSIGGNQTVSLIQANNGKANFIHTDVSQTQEVKSLITNIVSTFGHLDCAFNNAGVSSQTKALTAESLEDDWERIISTNLKGVWLCMKYELLQMQSQGKGIIVNTASTAGLIAHPGHCAYAASKHGILGLTRTAAIEYAQTGIRINAVCPGYIRTPMLEKGINRDGGDKALEMAMIAKQPSGRLGTAEEVAEVVLWLCSSAASYVMGQGIVIDGGLSVY
jgi:NAD(P)-dependent dehydrogenase (short-subunit alcohol dehydrogenase family)